jgi:hypothetical protein
MNLLELRTQFVKISGRYDLVVDTTDWVDNGADFYINAGQNFLDRLRDTPKAQNTIFTALDAGEWYVTFARCRSIREVWINMENSQLLSARPIRELLSTIVLPVFDQLTISTKMILESSLTMLKMPVIVFGEFSSLARLMKRLSWRFRVSFTQMNSHLISLTATGLLTGLRPWSRLLCIN